ncbi:DUF7831 domain-containing protein, partial [Thalassospira sp. CH_XMU1420-2]|uniref:DUF7831 domain-containing protein n=1 Tax=Thalassospira sp. CH_XMU1420-2 TaxID=3107769 RepID=UPI00300B4DCC
MDPLPEDAVPENTRPKIMFRDHITREMVQSEPAVLFVFGDNLKREGLGGQAKAMRGEHNAVGIPTKKEPTTEETAYFCDADFKMWKEASYTDWRRLFDHVKEGGHIVWPSNGIGSGLAKLQEKA